MTALHISLMALYAIDFSLTYLSTLESQPKLIAYLYRRCKYICCCCWPGSSQILRTSYLCCKCIYEIEKSEKEMWQKVLWQSMDRVRHSAIRFRLSLYLIILLNYWITQSVSKQALWLCAGTADLSISICNSSFFLCCAWICVWMDGVASSLAVCNHTITN